MKKRLTTFAAGSDEHLSASTARSASKTGLSPAASMPDARAASLAQLQHQHQASSSSQAAQLKERADLMAGRNAESPVQRAEEEDLLQGKLDVAQRAGDEELLQGEFAPGERMDEEESVQGKFEALQKKEIGPSLQGDVRTMALSNDRREAPVQREEKPNNTGLSNQLKSGIESLSGISMDHVKVHYNSNRPAQLNAHAYAQGSDIHVAPGQEQHVPHEAWHVVQQAQGRVRPTMQMKAGVPVNDDIALESEADVMGARAMTAGAAAQLFESAPRTDATTVRQNYAIRIVGDSARNHYADGWGAAVGITDDASLIANVPSSVRGAGDINFGWITAPAAEQIYPRNFQKRFSIGYRNASEEETTFIYHCGPSAQWRYRGPIVRDVDEGDLS